MPEYVTPTQYRYNDPYQQRIFDYGTVDSRVYLSRATNMLLKAFGNNIVLSGLNVSSVSGVGGSTATVVISAGYAVQDSTLLEILSGSTLTLNVSTLADTTTGGCHLGVFLDYSYLDSVVENPVIVRLYHISADGMTITPSGFNPDRCQTLIAAVNFTKSGSNITAISEYTEETLSVNGTTMYIKGYNPNNIYISSLVAVAGRNNTKTVSSWTLDATTGLYYADVAHPAIALHHLSCYNASTNKLIYPTEIEKINNSCVRVWMPVNSVTINMLY